MNSERAKTYVNDALATLRSVVGSLAFGAVIVSQVVGVVLIEISGGILGSELALPVEQGLVELEAGSFEEETELESSEVLEVVDLTEFVVEELHARREGS